MSGALTVRAPQTIGDPAERERLTRHNLAWTAEEDCYLTRRAATNRPSVIAVALGRTPRAVIARARLLAIQWGHTLPHPARFWAKVAITPGCWLWLASTDAHGYGQYAIRRAPRRAHRVAYELLVGPIPEGMDLDHVRARGCTNRRCVNPDHLEAVTHLVNVLRGDSPAARQARQTHCKRGHEFTPENTRYRADRNIRSCRTCAQEYGRTERARRKEGR